MYFYPFPHAHNLQEEKRFRFSCLSDKEGIAEEIRFWKIFWLLQDKKSCRNLCVFSSLSVVF